MKVLSRQLTVDLYNCKASTLGDASLLHNVIKHALINQGHTIVNFAAEEIDDAHYGVTVLHTGGHIALHVYKNLLYVAADIFLCHEKAEPEEIYKELRNYFKPEKMKTTFLKRGDFKEKEVKPKIKTRVAPLRKIHNTGVKVARVLARRNND